MASGSTGRRCLVAVDLSRLKAADPLSLRVLPTDTNVSSR